MKYLIIPLLFFSLIARAQDEHRLDSLISARYTAVAPGCVILIAKQGQVIYRKAFGLSDQDQKLAMPVDGVFRLGSMSKQYTAVAILQLAEQGKLKLSDSIQVYVKDFPHKAWPVTIGHLLSQSSGVINFQEIRNPDPKKVHEHYTPQQGVDYFKDEPLRFQPGSRFEYSNSNFFLLGYIIEQVTGESYGQYIEEHLLQPAQLTRTYYLWPGKPIPGLVSGYSRFDHRHWEPAELQEVTMLYATGGLAANIDDVWRWHQALTENKLLSPKSLQAAWTAFPLSQEAPQYGYGWFIRQLDGLKTVEHSGSTDGYQTNELYIPEKDLFVAALFNGFETDMDWQVLTNDIARLALNGQLRNTLRLPDERLRSYTGTYRYNADHSMIVTFQNHQLYIEATNPKDHLPKLPLIAASADTFYIKEAALTFRFTAGNLETSGGPGKPAIWQKIMDR